MDQQRRSILVVDGDVQIQRLLDLSLRNVGFEVKAVATVAEATAWLGKERPDLIVAEAKLDGGGDGFELCRQVKKRPDAASIAFLFLAERTVETNLRAVEAGADDFVAKPLYVQELVARVRAVLQRRERDRLEARTRQGGADDEKFAGELEALPLVDLLRAIQTNKRSGAVQITAPDGARGEIYFRDGAVVDAEVGRLSGLDAVCRLFSWTAGRFEIEWKSIRRKDAVALESGALLLEALRRLDEWRRVLAEVAPLETIFEVDYHVLAERLAEIPDEVNAILRLFDGQRTFIHVIDDCGLSDLDALAVIGKLHREQIIRDVRARPAAVELPGADMEGWIADAAGPFRALSMRPRRELFSPLPDAGSGVHRRPTAPPEHVEEAPRSPSVGERRERFTDRLIAEGAAPAPEAPAPPPVRPREVLDPAEKTQQGLGLPAPALSTRPGFAAVAVVPQAPPAPRVARDVLTDVTESLGAAAPAAQGIPQAVPRQSAEPAIVVPLVPAVPQVPVVAPPVVAAAPPPPVEQKPVAGEIVAPPRSTKEDGTPKRVTDLGMGPERVASVSAFAATSPLAAASGEVVGAPVKVEEVRPAKKIILDPAIPEDNEVPPPSRRLKLVLGGGAGLALAGVLIWLGFSKTERPHDEAAKVEAPPAKVTEVADARPVAAAPDAGAAPAPAKRTGPAYEAARKVLEERAGDPKVARALPAEFPVLLAACRTAFTEKRAKDAEIACVAAKDAGPDSAEACALLGHALFGRKKRKEALVWAERAVELDPKQADAYVIIGGVKQAGDDSAGAKVAYKKYLELAPAGQYAADLRAILSTLEAP